MKTIKVFYKNKDGKIEFTNKELEKLLNETYREGYHEGYSEGTSNTFTWSQPYLTNTCDSATITLSNNSIASCKNESEK